MIVGSFFGALLVFGVIFIYCCFFRKKNKIRFKINKKSKKSSKSENSEREMGTITKIKIDRELE